MVVILLFSFMREEETNARLEWKCIKMYSNSNHVD